MVKILATENTVTAAGRVAVQGWQIKWNPEKKDWFIDTMVDTVSEGFFVWCKVCQYDGTGRQTGETNNTFRVDRGVWGHGHVKGPDSEIGVILGIGGKGKPARFNTSLFRKAKHFLESFDMFTICETHKAMITAGLGGLQLPQTYYPMGHFSV